MSVMPLRDALPSPKILRVGTPVKCRRLFGDRTLHIAGVLVSPRATSQLYWFEEEGGVVALSELTEVANG